MAGMEGLLMGFAWLNFFILILGVLLLVGMILGFIFWIAMIVDCAKRNLSAGEKIAWMLVIIFLHDIGAVIYYFAVKKK